MCRGTQTGSNPGDWPQEPTEQTTKLPQYNHLMNKGAFLMTGVGGERQATGSIQGLQPTQPERQLQAQSVSLILHSEGQGEERG